MIPTFAYVFEEGNSNEKVIEKTNSCMKGTIDYKAFIS